MGMLKYLAASSVSRLFRRVENANLVQFSQSFDFFVWFLENWCLLCYRVLHRCWFSVRQKGPLAILNENRQYFMNDAHNFVFNNCPEMQSEVSAEAKNAIEPTRNSGRSTPPRDEISTQPGSVAMRHNSTPSGQMPRERRAATKLPPHSGLNPAPVRRSSHPA
jgi:hypothetical protein